MPLMNLHSWSPEKIRAFKKAYKAAKTKRLAQFEFEGRQYVTKFAHYILHYLEGKPPDEKSK